MGSEIDFIFYVTSTALLTVLSGAANALEVLSLSLSEKQGGEDDDDGRFVARLLRDPIHNGIALGISRAAAIALVVIASMQLSSRSTLLTQNFVVAGLFVVASTLVPVFLAKVIAVQGADRFLGASRPIVVPIVYILRPVAVLVEKLLGRLSPTLLTLLSLHVIPLKQKIEVLGSQNNGEVDEEQLIMTSMLEFGETRVREVMVPRIDIVAVNVAMDKTEAIEVIVDAGHSRIPVYEETVDKIVGTLYTKDLLRRIAAGDEFELDELVRDTFFVPESKMIDDLLTEFKVRKQHLAVVVDEYGGTAGLVTLEDVLEEIVGDIQDEFDTEEALLKWVDSHSVICNAKIHVDELNDLLDTQIPDDVADSLGGLLYHMIGRVPRVGDTWEHESLVFRIESVVRQRIGQVRISGAGISTETAEDQTG
jgi:putative hemolysin